MLNARKKRKHTAQQEQTTAPVRRSERESRPSQRLREVENLFDVPPPPNRRPPDTSDEDNDLTDQLEVAHERIVQLQLQLSAALEKQTHHNKEDGVTIHKDGRPGVPSTSTGISRTAIRLETSDDQEFIDDNPQRKSDNSKTTKMDHQQNQSSPDLNHMISKAMSQIINPHVEDNEGKKLASSYLILGATLDPKVKSKIWSREYVELSSLHQGQMDSAVSVSVQDNGKPSISLRPTKPTPAANIYQWLTWFGTYASVYLEKFPDQAPSLMTYMIRILELSCKHHGFLWRTYDENFRHMRSYVDDMPHYKLGVDLAVNAHQLWDD